jgi:hypothetical protein
MKTLSTLLLVILLTAIGAMPSFSQKWGAYTLYSVQNSKNAYLVDTNDGTYHTWTFSAANPSGYSCYLLPNRVLLRSVKYTPNSFAGGGQTGKVQKVDWDGNIIWDFVYSTSTYSMHHDICPMPNGNVLLICYESKTAAEATQAGSSQNIVMWPEKVVEIQPTGATTGTVVWEWHVWDHLVQNVNSAKDNYYSSIVNHPELININYKTSKDWLHMNGIDYNEELDQIVVSSHNLNELYVIDHSTTTAQAAGHTGGKSGKGGDILYRWGNPAAYGASGTTIFNVVHDAHWIPKNCPRANSLVGFNNSGVSATQSSVDIIAPPYEGYNYTITQGSAFTPSTYTKRFACNGRTSNEGNSQQLPNGNVLYCMGLLGKIYEVDSNNNLLWSKSTGGTVGQAFRYSADYVNGTSSLSATASATIPTICLGQSTQLKAEVTGGSSYTYSWASNPVGFTSSEQNPTVSPTVSTVYTVTVTSSGNSTSSTVTVSVNPLPKATVTTDGYTTICQGSSLILHANSGTGLTYQWRKDGMTIQGATSSNYTATAAGNYKVLVTNTNNCTDSSAVVTLKVNPLPIANAGNDVTITKGQSATFTATGGVKYLWNTGDTTASIKVSPTSTTTYSVRVSDSVGCSSSDEVIVTVAGSTISATASATPINVCKGTATQLNATVVGGSSNLIFMWSSIPDGFTSSKQNPSVEPTVNTIYTVKVINGSDTATSSISVTVLELPAQPIITQNQKTLMASPANGYQWFLDGNPIQNANSQSFEPNKNGLYQVRTVGQNGCLSSLSEMYNYQGLNSVNEDESLSLFSCYPNPTNGLLTLSGSILDNKFDVMIIDALGRVVLETTSTKIINLSGLPNGCYYLSIRYGTTDSIGRRITVFR